jgi:hypothetical protein
MLNSTQAKEMEDLAGGWIHDARACRVGDYLVVAPDRKGSPDVWLSRNKRPFFGVSKNTTTLLDDDGRRVIYDWDRGRSRISYAAHNSLQHAWVENVDLDADGSVDLRFTKSEVGDARTEFRFADHWLELVTRDHKSGVVLDGRFMSVKDAEEQLGAKVASGR